MTDFTFMGGGFHDDGSYGPHNQGNSRHHETTDPCKTDANTNPSSFSKQNSTSLPQKTPLQGKKEVKNGETGGGKKESTNSALKTDRPHESRDLRSSHKVQNTSITHRTYKQGFAREWIRQGFGKEKNPKGFRGVSQSTQSLVRALSFLSEIGQLKGKALFVGDKPEHGLLFHEYLADTPHSYLSCGWVPGLLTNSSQHECTQQAHQVLARILKEKPRALRGRAAKIFESREHIYAHINDLKPDVIIFLGDEDYRSGALQECHKLQIPTVALCKTPLWASQVTYPVFFQTSIQIVHKLTKLFRNALSGEFA